MGNGPFSLSGFFFHKHSRIRGQRGKGGGHFFSSSLALLPDLWAPGHLPSDCCGGLASVQVWQLDSGQGSLVSGRGSLATGLRALKPLSYAFS